MLESEGSGLQKIAIFGVILLAFGAIGYFATSGGSAPATDAKTAAAEPAADAGNDSKAAASAASAAGDAAAAPDASMSASATAATPASASEAAAPAPADTSATASADATSVAAPSAPADAPAAPSETAAAAPAPTAAPEPMSPPPVASASDESAAASEPPHPQHHASSSGAAKHKAPAKVAANAPPPALDVLSHWWAPSTATSAFRVAAVGEVEGGGGIAVVFNDEVSNWNAAAQKLQLVDANGAPVPGNWTGGENRRVMVYQHLSAGRYRLAIDPTLVSVHGQTIGLPLAGPVYVQ